MRRAIHAEHLHKHFGDEKMGLPEILMEVAYVVAFVTMVGLMLLPYLIRTF